MAMIMAMTLLSRVVNKHRSNCLHSALAHRRIKLYETKGKDNNINTLNIRYSKCGEREREREREVDKKRGGDKQKTQK